MREFRSFARTHFGAPSRQLPRLADRHKKIRGREAVGWSEKTGAAPRVQKTREMSNFIVCVRLLKKSALFGGCTDRYVRFSMARCATLINCTVYGLNFLYTILMLPTKIIISSTFAVLPATRSFRGPNHSQHVSKHNLTKLIKITRVLSKFVVQ